MNVFILGSRDESRPTRIEFIPPMSHKHCSRVELSTREDRLLGISFPTFHPVMTFHPGARAYDRDEIVPG